MIVVVCTDDDDAYNAAARDAFNFPEVYGDVYKAFDDNIPKLQPGENLFVQAHGAAIGDDGNAVIGSQADDFYVNAVDLWTNIRDIFPDMYSGGVFVNACESADFGRGGDVLSFATAFETQIGLFHDVEVFGRNGSPSVEAPIPFPDNPAWVAARD